MVRHRKHNVGLNRTASHRRALLANLAGALFTHKKIITTLPKAKAARSFAERLITFARKGDLAARRQVLRKIRDKVIVDELFRTIGPKFRDRNGGYTRIIHLDNRIGDNAPMAILELIGFAVDDTGKKRTKSRKGKAPKPETVTRTAAEPAEEVPAEVLEEPVAADEVKDKEAVETAGTEGSAEPTQAGEAETEEVEAALPEEEKQGTSAEEASSDTSVTEADDEKKEPEKSTSAEDTDSPEAGTVSGRKEEEDKNEENTSKRNQSE